MTEGAAFVVYGLSLTVVVVLMALRGGRSHGMQIYGLVVSLVILFLVGYWRWTAAHGVGWPLTLIACWLNISLIVGTFGNPLRAVLNSAEMSRARGLVRGSGPATGRGERYVDPPLRGPFVGIFVLGCVILCILWPDNFLP